mmetsp:Transcript_1904/g.2101  ORF Transcript_1904/g.2101 Transcript_1904/m.2101 type:complete len:331 (+) Transcript_1904:378-1370(+)
MPVKPSSRLLLWATVLLVPLNALATLLWIIGSVSSVSIIVLGIVGTIGFIVYSSLLAVNVKPSLPLGVKPTYTLLRNTVFPLIAIFMGFAAGIILGAVCGSFWYYSLDGVDTVNDDFISDVNRGKKLSDGSHPYGFIFEKEYEIILQPELWTNATAREDEFWTLVCLAPISFSPGTSLQNSTERVMFYVSCSKHKGVSCWKNRNQCIEEWWAPTKRDSARMYSREKLWQENLEAIKARNLSSLSNPVILSYTEIDSTISTPRIVLIVVYCLINLLYITIIGGTICFIFPLNTLGICPVRSYKGTGSEISTNQRTANTNLTSGTLDTQTQS